MNAPRDFDVKDTAFAGEGRKKIKWARRSMPVLSSIQKRFTREAPLKNVRIAACLHVTAETANLMLALKAGGAAVRLCASNPLSTQDDVAAALALSGIPVFAIKDESNKTYYRHIDAALKYTPAITLDDGADLVMAMIRRGETATKNTFGGTEETTTGVTRLESMEKAHTLPYPVIAVNDAKVKHLFDNRYGTGQSTMDGILRATNMLIAGTTVVVCGYGWCGRGVALRAKGMGARVIITEVDPIRALEALMDGYSVMPARNAAPRGDVFITATGNKNVLTREHFTRMKDGAILCNAGHFNTEIDINALQKIATSCRTVRPLVKEYIVDGKRIRVLAEGRLVNLACAEGHPPTVMDMSFSCQALAVEYLCKNRRKLSKKVHAVPEAIDTEIARLKLASTGTTIDSLTEAQLAYLASWDEGT